MIFAIALVVRDTDGSAFITKAEFDSLKNNFQSQINNYNSSIDSKIDGAIAAYLAGIKLSSMVSNTCIGYHPAGVLSVVPYDNIDWKEGDIKFSVDITTYYGQRSGSYYPGYFRIQFPAKGIRSGRTGPTECLVTVFRSGATPLAGLWRGNFVNNKIDFKCIGFVRSSLFKPVGTQGSSDTKIYVRNNLSDQSATHPDTPLANGWFNPISNKPFTNEGTKDGGEFFFGTYWGRTSACTTSSLSGYTTQCLCTRELGTQTNANIISASNLNSFSRFTDYDAFYDFCNDTRFEGHSIVSSETDYFGTPWYDSQVTDGTTNWTGPFTINWGDPMVNATPYVSWIKSNMNKTAAQSSLYPYVGFAKELNNFNKIYTDKYSDFIQDILNEHPSVKTYEDTKTNQRYVNVGAGFIFGKVKENDIIKIPIKFEDQTKLYDIWLRVGPFDPNKSAWEADSYEVIYNDENCLTPLPLGAHPNSRVVSGGEQYIYLKPNSSGYLFMMWAYNDINKNGGGVFLPASTYISISEN